MNAEVETARRQRARGSHCSSRWEHNDVLNDLKIGDRRRPRGETPTGAIDAAIIHGAKTDRVTTLDVPDVSVTVA
jgi:hypothetical protein